MATLTTTTGIQLTFDPSAIAALADHDDTGAAVTCIYGVTSAPLFSNEAVPALIARLGLGTKLARLTRPTGNPVWLKGAGAVLVRAPVPGDAPGANAVVFVGGMMQAVQEASAAAVAQLNGAGANL